MITDKDMQRIKDALLGTCDSVTAVLERLEIDADENDVEDKLLDGNPSVEECKVCNWWFESCDLVCEEDENQNGTCDDCREETC